MWTYEVITGELFDSENDLVATGYSGAPLARNDVSKETEEGVGPLPRGEYAVGEPEDTTKHGPYVLRLTPTAGDMFGRSGFLIHGDSIEHPGTASHGCIILPRHVREQIWKSDDHELEVI